MIDSSRFLRSTLLEHIQMEATAAEVSEAQHGTGRSHSRRRLHMIGLGNTHPFDIC